MYQHCLPVFLSDQCLNPEQSINYMLSRVSAIWIWKLLTPKTALLDSTPWLDKLFYKTLQINVFKFSVNGQNNFYKVIEVLFCLSLFYFPSGKCYFWLIAIISFQLCPCFWTLVKRHWVFPRTLNLTSSRTSPKAGYQRLLCDCSLFWRCEPAECFCCQNVFC